MHKRSEFLLLLFNREFNSNLLKQTTVYVLSRYIVAKVLTCHSQKVCSYSLPWYFTLPSMTSLKIQCNATYYHFSKNWIPTAVRTRKGKLVARFEVILQNTNNEHLTFVRENHAVSNGTSQLADVMFFWKRVILTFRGVTLVWISCAQLLLVGKKEKFNRISLMVQLILY